MCEKEKQARHQRQLGGPHCWRASSCAKEEKILKSIAEKTFCLYASLVSQPNATLFQLIKASYGLSFLVRCAGASDRQGTNNAAKNSLSFLLHLAQ